jgi:hypothetical protein
MTTQKDITVTLTLSTDAKYGNSTGCQIDTLAVAVNGSDYNDTIDSCADWLTETEKNVLDSYDYTDDFLATLTAKEARELYEDKEKYEKALDDFAEDLKDQARDYSLNDSHPLAKEIYKARDSVEKEMRHEWLYGDYRGDFDGIIKLAQKRYGLDLEISYDEKKDEIAITVPAFLAEEWRDNGDIDDTSEATIGDYLTSSIENDAEARHTKELAERKKRREEYDIRLKIRLEKEACEEKERKEKLLKIIK